MSPRPDPVISPLAFVALSNRRIRQWSFAARHRPAIATARANATQMAPERRGAAVSAFAFCFFMGQSAGLALAGAATASVGTRGIIVGGAVGVLIVALGFARLKSNQRALGRV